MKPIYIKRLILGLLITGIMAFVYLVLIQPDGSRGHLINYAILRVIFMGLTGIILLFLAAVLIRFQVNQAWGRGVSEKIDEMLTHSGERLFNLRFGLVITFIFLAEGFLLTWFTLPIPARPVILWMASACIFSWAALRAAYRGIFSKRQSLLRRSDWAGRTGQARSARYLSFWPSWD
jgi:hypothetical protein